MKGVLIVSTKGGTGKTALCHALALGAAWKGIPAHLLHTDNRKPLEVNNRPYMYYDARELETLTRIMGAAVNSDGLCIIDSGGNRPEFDKWLAGSVDLALIPVTPDPEAVDLAKDHMQLLENHSALNVRFILNMVSSNRFERISDHDEYFSSLPEEKIIGQVSKVAAIKRLRTSDKYPFVAPPTKINNLARKLYYTVKDVLDAIDEKQKRTTA